MAVAAVADDGGGEGWLVVVVPILICSFVFLALIIPASQSAMGKWPRS